MFPTLGPTSATYFNRSDVVRVATAYGDSSSEYSYIPDYTYAAVLNNPEYIAFDRYDNIYLSDGIFNVIRVINTTSGDIVTVAGENSTTGGYNGIDEGPALSVQLNNPTSILFDGNGDLIIADSGNQMIRKLYVNESYVETLVNLAIITVSSAWSYANVSFIDTTNDQVVYNLAWNTQNQMLYISDAVNCLIYTLALPGANISSSLSSYSQGTLYAGVLNGGNGVCGSSGSGSYFLQRTSFNTPLGLAFDSFGNLFVADSANNRILKLFGSVSSVYVGTGVQGYSGDGAPGKYATFNHPSGITVVNDGARSAMFICDANNSVVRSVAMNSNKLYIETIAGDGTAGYNGDDNPSVQTNLNFPINTALSSTKQIFFADSKNNRIRFLYDTAPTHSPTVAVVSTSSKAVGILERYNFLGIWIILAVFIVLLAAFLYVRANYSFAKIVEEDVMSILPHHLGISVPLNYQRNHPDRVEISVEHLRYLISVH